MGKQIFLTNFPLFPNDTSWIETARAVDKYLNRPANGTLLTIDESAGYLIKPFHPQFYGVYDSNEVFNEPTENVSLRSGEGVVVEHPKATGSSKIRGKR